MTHMIFRDEPYKAELETVVMGLTPDGGLILEGSIFYPQGGGQPGDSGRVDWPDGSVSIETTRKGEGDAIVLIPGASDPLPQVGATVRQVLDWQRRHSHMRVHSALHLLSVVIPLPVTGGAISEGRGRLDFLMPDPDLDKEALEARLNDLVAQDMPLGESWITDEELEANPGLIKTMSVQPPKGQGSVRLIRIGSAAAPLDIQPCGGTHVASTGEIGRITIGKIENKGRQNRRVNIQIA